MGVFDDKKFEELDWISQATEPIDSKLNEALGSIPEVINIDFQTYVDMLSYSADISIDNAISYCLKKYCSVDLSYDQRAVLKDMFEFQMSDESLILDFETKTISGEIKLIKLANTMDEKVLEGLLGQEGINVVSIMSMGPGSIPRANEVMELLGKCEEGLRSRSERKKRHAIRSRLVALFKANEWNLRDTELANKVGTWIAAYVTHGNLAAFSNFCRLKVMTHKGQPIYSMEEVK